jgi:hypothetical protein
MATASFAVARQNDGEDLPNDDLFKYATANYDRIKALIQTEMTKTLGEKYRIGEFRIYPGSAIIFFEVLTEHVKTFTENGWVLLGVTVAAIDGFLNTMDRFASGLSSVLRFFFQKAQPAKIGAGPIIVQPVWHPSAGLLVTIVNASSAKLGTEKLLIRYLIISHAILLGLLGAVVAHFMHWLP